ncbi:hypothetical protein ACFLXC_03245 [Chloroflexota bacterium]
MPTKESIDNDWEIFKVGTKLLGKALDKEKQAVRLIGVGVSNLVEPSRQAKLFAPSDQKLKNLTKAIDHIRDQYGFGAIQTGRTILRRDIPTRR